MKVDSLWCVSLANTAVRVKPVSDHGTDPLQLVAAWLSAARGAGEVLPEAMTLATVTPDGWPSARLVMLRGLDRGLVFFTDGESEKGVDLGAHPRAALVLHWLTPQHRQVRVVGDVEPVTRRESDEYWRSRRPEVRRSAAASVQSAVIASRAVLEERVNDLARRYPDGVGLPRPDRWVGFRVLPALVEFWQEAGDGLHDRFRYRRAADSWTIELLSP
jgi:pyridoxamine 5'-phosphate oxidase